MFRTENEMKRSFCPTRGSLCLGSGCQAMIANHALETETGRRVPLAQRYSGSPVTVFYYCGQYPKPSEIEHEIPPLEV